MGVFWAARCDGSGEVEAVDVAQRAQVLPQRLPHALLGLRAWDHARCIVEVLGQVRPLDHLGEEQRPGSRHDLVDRVSPAPNANHLPSQSSCASSWNILPTRGQMRVVHAMCASGSSWCVSQPSWVTSTVGLNRRSMAGTTFSNPSSQGSSHANGSNGRLAAAPLPSPEPESRGNPVPGNRYRPLSCRLIVRTSGSE